MEAAVATKWAIDPAHSEIDFKVKHLVISTVTGKFKSFTGTVINIGENFDFHQAKVKLTIEVASIDTNQSDRDKHLKSEDFFYADQHPKIEFEGVLTKKNDDEFTLSGPLTIRGNTKNVDLDVEFGGTMVDAYGNTKAGFEVSGKINRKEFGLNWSQVTEAGGIVVGDKVKIQANIQLIKQ